ncbi:MAG TPA: PilN domain-containing protein [Kineobactrum sp.]
MQNLNLYQRETVQRSGPAPNMMLLGLGTLLVLCLLHGSWLTWQLQQGGQRLAQAERLAQVQKQQIDTAEKNFVAPQRDAQLPVQLARQEAQNQALQRLLNWLALRAEEQRGGFVAPLAALAAQHPPNGLWLTEITLSGGDMRLRGFSQNPQLLPEYVRRLSQNAVFAGRLFARLDIARDDDTQLLRFDLSSRPANQEARQD